MVAGQVYEKASHALGGERQPLLATHNAPLPGRAASSQQQQHRARRPWQLKVIFVALAVIVTSHAVLPFLLQRDSLVQTSVDDLIVRWIHASSSVAPDVCPQEPAWQRPEGAPTLNYPPDSELANRLSGAVKIDTTVHDDEPSPEEDPDLWSHRFEPFRNYLETTFPRVHGRVEGQDSPVTRELVHEHGLLYTWKGEDADLKPIMFMAHQDVVPVDPETLDDWWEPPFSGAIVNNTVFGRGTTDVKSVVISVMSSLEALVEAGFKPKRTILISFGYDEEVHGTLGGQALGKRIEELYGKDSVAMIVDEGNPVLSAYDRVAGLGMPIAVPGTEEKGQAHVRIRIEAPGGHSSQPPKRTTIGLLGEIVSSFEEGPDNLREPVIEDLESAHLKTLQCMRDSPIMPHAVRQALKHLDWASRSSLPDLVAASSSGVHSSVAQFMSAAFGITSERRRKQRVERAKRALLVALPDQFKLPWATTQTPTILHAGIKLNAIPPSAQVEIDHRVALHHDLEAVKDWYTTRMRKFAEKHALDLVAFGQAITNGNGGDGGMRSGSTLSTGKLMVDIVGPPLAPAPRTPTSGEEAKPWRIFQSVVRRVWTVPHSDDDDESQGKPVLVSPAQMRGNTDTRWMWNLSSHIFRFIPSTLLPDETPAGSAFAGVHGVNEHFAIDGLRHAVRFYADLVVAADAAEL